MLESGLSGSVRGVPSNGHPYRDPGPVSDIGHGRVFMSSCVYRFTLGERAFQDSRNKKARLSITGRRA
jgi:hypothetical protein